jgi:hypothetical protein
VGHGPVALFLTFLIVIFVGYMAVTRKDVEEAPSPAWSGHRRGAPSSAEYRPDQGGPLDEERYQRRPGRSPYERGSFDEERYQRRPGRSPYERGSFDEERYPPRSGWPPDQGGSLDEGPYPPRPGDEEPYQQQPRDEEPYQQQPRDEEPRRPPEGFFAWDDR